MIYFFDREDDALTPHHFHLRATLDGETIVRHRFPVVAVDGHTAKPAGSDRLGHFSLTA